MSQRDFDISTLDRIDRTDLPADGGEAFNRLIFSDSPYLRQHASNPVDWYPWSAEAFAKAAAEDKPVFLSIGYSTCHWCHVMAAESFANQAVAELLNAGFVAIKVDREERPDIDNLYMNACQLMTGSGGWPLTLLLTPDQQPFFAATYLPPRGRSGRFGLSELLQRVDSLWRGQRDELLRSGAELTRTLQALDSSPAAEITPSEQPLRRALNDYRQTFDPQAGGFGTAPKFPTPHNLSLLLRLSQRLAAPDAGRMACATLDAIRAGGVYDQVGFGLHRYAVDAGWRIPHFEKMLYDQALFMLAALDAWQTTGDPDYAAMVSDTADYLLRDLLTDQGAFSAGEDADSAGEEGSFYLWTPAELHNLLGRPQAELFGHCYGIDNAGQLAGKSVPRQMAPWAELAAQTGLELATLRAHLDSARQTLHSARLDRPRPARDDKVIVAWNGLAITALARCGVALARRDWIETAAGAARFLQDKLVDRNGRLRRYFRRTATDIPGFVDDYAALAWGLFELHQADFRDEDLAASCHWAEQTLLLFGEAGDLYDSGHDSEALISRSRTLVDGAVPSAGAVLTGLLLRLADLTGEQRFAAAGQTLLAKRLGHAERQPTAHAQLLLALDHHLGPSQQLTMRTATRERAEPLLATVYQRFLPRLVVRIEHRAGTDPRREDARTGQPAVTASLCADRVCLPEVTTPRDLATLLDRLTMSPVSSS
ncbi:MAG: thioredoxin domain-containing protein [Desulfuromonadales bacterium]|nr:thioredoxin domain-containing protein [Desulfuromonadales bacterium]